MRLLAPLIVLLLGSSGAAQAQALDLGALAGPVDGATVAYLIQIFGLLTVLSVAPGILIMVTSFTRFVIAFSILRSGMGLPTTPANLVLVSLALFMTFYVMAPTFDRAWNEGVQPLINNEISEGEALERIADPFRDFMVRNVREEDLALFADLARERGQFKATPSICG
jgi:flagellar biosynthetic protein FliP